MVYNNFKDLKLSALGFGAMRLPVINNVYADIDFKAAEQMIDYAYKNGVNYFDTAWGYHDGESERVVGKILSKYPRDSYYLASKFPGYDLANMGKVEEIFNEQLKKCGVDYFDFYLFHNVCELNIDAYLDDEKYKTFAYLVEQKRKGRIKHLGFSTHGSIEVLTRFLNAYGSEMEFCLIQLNYFDYKFQKATEKIEFLEKHNLPIWVMEPLRGGKLASLDSEYEQKLTALRPNESIPSWAFRFMQSIKQVTVTLSGMSTFEQVKANIDTYKTNAPLNKAEMQALMEVTDSMIAKTSLPCTQCRYCTSHCPKGIPIPDIITIYNEHRFMKAGYIATMLLDSYAEDKRPSACVGCHSCEKVCPQNIKIADMMKDFTSRLQEK